MGGVRQNPRWHLRGTRGGAGFGTEGAANKSLWGQRVWARGQPCNALGTEAVRAAPGTSQGAQQSPGLPCPHVLPCDRIISLLPNLVTASETGIELVSGTCAATQGSCVPLLSSNSPALPTGTTTAANMSSKRAKAKTTKKRPQRATSNVFAMFDQSQIQEFKEAFNMIDQNRDGFIDKEDLHDMLASMGEETLPCPFFTSPSPISPYASLASCLWVTGTVLGEGSWSPCSEPTVGVALGHNPPALGQFDSAKTGETSSGALIGL